MLVVEADVDPPVGQDELEDWVRAPADPIEMHARVAVLQARAGRQNPVVDDSGRLNVGARWVALSPIECRLVTLLLEHFGGLVTRDVLLRVGWPASRPSDNQLYVQILRLRRRLAPIGLQVRTVKPLGYLLDYSEQQAFALRV